MTDRISAKQRSDVMAKVRSTGNRSTEGRVEIMLKTAGLMHWTKHPKKLPGRPDFLFSEEKVVVFVDGCFWHACPKCCRLPSENAKYWKEKIDSNRRRDNRTRRELRKLGYSVVRIWEHEIPLPSWIKRLRRILDNT